MSGKVNNEGIVRKSISIKLIRHAESMNNEVYRNARIIYKGGTPEFDQEGWDEYVEERRKADPGLSSRGEQQAQRLAQYLSCHLSNQASSPARVITSPMRRTIETILPTLHALNSTIDGGENGEKIQLMINALYHETEGCYAKGRTEPGMNQQEIRQLFSPTVSSMSFVGFSEDKNEGWYAHANGPELRQESEKRASAFFLWLCEYLDSELLSDSHDLFDAGVNYPTEVDEFEHDKLSPRKRKRRVAILVGHGDFMNLILKRIISGFGHLIENEGVPHRSAIVHFNTGITELEYFGKGRFLLMSSNALPHLSLPEDMDLVAGGGLKDGWSYLMPSDDSLLYEEVSTAFADELEDHVKEQTEALKNLYLSTSTRGSLLNRRSSVSLEGLDYDSLLNLNEGESEGSRINFVVKRGLQVLACAVLNESLTLCDVVMIPSAKSSACKVLLDAVKIRVKESKSDVFYIEVNVDDLTFFEENGCKIIEDLSANAPRMIRMSCSTC